MNLNFEEFKKKNLSFKELDNIRINNFKKFETLGFPTKKQEHWKYTDLKTIISNSFDELEIFKDKNNSKYKNDLIFKNFEHNKIILLNGKFVESNFEYEDEKKIKIKSLKIALKDEIEFKKIKNYFEDDQNSMISLNCFKEFS